MCVEVGGGKGERRFLRVGLAVGPLKGGQPMYKNAHKNVFKKCYVTGFTYTYKR